jgi:hypothetical protein
MSVALAVPTASSPPEPRWPERTRFLAGLTVTVLAGISGSSANNTIGLLGEIETIENRPINKTNSAIQMDSIFFFSNLAPK